MKSFGVYEAKNRLTELLKAVANGESFMLTKHGKPIASIQPYRPEGSAVKQGVSELRALGDCDFTQVDFNDD